MLVLFENCVFKVMPFNQWFGVKRMRDAECGKQKRACDYRCNNREKQLLSAGKMNNSRFTFLVCTTVLLTHNTFLSLLICACLLKQK